jgi:hypothetical protein
MSLLVYPLVVFTSIMVEPALAAPPALKEGVLARTYIILVVLIY